MVRRVKAVLARVRTKLFFVRAPHVILGYRRHLIASEKPKRALLSYLVEPVHNDSKGIPTIRFSNHGLAITWARVLNELGYSVDIINWDATDFAPRQSYDLVVFHGGKNYDSLQGAIGPDTQVIHFTAGSYWKYNNRTEERQLKAVNKRRNASFLPERFVQNDEDPVNEAADLIVALGSPRIRSTFPKSLRTIQTLDIGTYPDDHYEVTPKDFSKTRSKFVYYSGSGNIHKGLDLLLEAFEGLEQELYIVGHMDEEFLRSYSEELKASNIHLIGQVEMRSQEFYGVIDQCAFVILPSCSEGQPGSVVECMNDGLIPIVSKQCWLDCDKYGFILPNCTVTTIRNMVRDCSKLSNSELGRRSRLSHEVTLKDHSPDTFKHNLTRIVSSL